LKSQASSTGSSRASSVNRTQNLTTRKPPSLIAGSISVAQSKVSKRPNDASETDQDPDDGDVEEGVEDIDDLTRVNDTRVS
jgi:hypothetical protein